MDNTVSVESSSEGEPYRKGNQIAEQSIQKNEELRLDLWIQIKLAGKSETKQRSSTILARKPPAFHCKVLSESEGKAVSLKKRGESGGGWEETERGVSDREGKLKVYKQRRVSWAEEKIGCSE